MSKGIGELVEPEWLLRHLDDPAVRVLDCRFSLADPGLGRRQYAEAHIPAALYADLATDLSGAAGTRTGRHPLPDPETLARRLAEWGINSEDTGSPTLVVAYDDSKLMCAARLWWLLRYLGHPRVAVLNASWSTWVRLGLPVTADVPSPPRGRFLPRPEPERLASYEDVRACLDRPRVALIDSRSPERHRGLHEPIDPVAGTIPGSRNCFSEAVVDDTGRMRPADWLADYWRSLDQAEETIVFCGSGVAACANILSQVVAGRAPSRLYVGGWSEWCRRHDERQSDPYPEPGASPQERNA